MKELRKIPTEKLGYRQAAAGPYLHVSARRGNKKKTDFRHGIPRFRNIKTR